MSDLVRPSFVSVTCLLRGLPLFFSAAPRTPLRVLAIVALDTLHVLRQSEPLPRKKIRELAMLLDFQACTNAVWDEKDLCHARYQVLRQRLERAGLGSCIEEYLRRLRELESRRPAAAGDDRRFDDVRSYREAVVRLSLATAIALDAKRIEEEVRATHGDSDVEALFRIVMQCQIIDDVLDYTEDHSAGLPSFLTACASLPRALELTAKTARHYAASRESPSDDGVFPLRMALWVCTSVTNLMVRVAHGRIAWRALAREPMTRSTERQ